MDCIVKKLNSRMYCLRKLTSFHIRPEILNVFYKSIIVSVSGGGGGFCLVCWGGNVSKSDKRRIDKLSGKQRRSFMSVSYQWAWSTSIS